jgi:hypothetical protein
MDHVKLLSLASRDANRARRRGYVLVTGGTLSGIGKVNLEQKENIKIFILSRHHSCFFSVVALFSFDILCLENISFIFILLLSIYT